MKMEVSVTIVSDSLRPRGLEARQVPLSMGFSRPEYWSGLPFPPPGDLPGPGIKHTSLMSPALAGEFFSTRTSWEAGMSHITSSGLTRANYDI